MTSPLKVCVYCGSQSGNGEAYLQSAIDMGALCASEGWALVYGGGRVGLMGATADAALKGGAPVIGIIPQDLHDREVAHLGLTELHITKSMHERQMMMARMGDAFIMLPGGFGTLAEFFEILTWRQLRFHLKPVILVNIGGYWDTLLEMLKQVHAEGFLHSFAPDLFHVVDAVEQIPEILAKFPPPVQTVKTEKM